MATTAVLSASAKPGRAQQPQAQPQHGPPLRAQTPLSAGSTRTQKHRSSNVFWIKLNFTVKAARLQSLKRHKYQHLQEEALLRARGLLKNWEDGPVLLIEDLYRQATTSASASASAGNEDANELLNYTPEALALRFSLRNDSAVLSAVKELWTIDTGPRDALGCIDLKAYTSLFRRIAKCVDAEAFPQTRTAHPHHQVPKRMEQTIHEDWKRDSKGESEMSFANFFDSVFELADLWCETIDVDEYVDFLRRVKDRISERKTKKKNKAGPVLIGKRVLRPMKKVRPLDEDDSEEDEDESESNSTSEGSEEDSDTTEPVSVVTSDTSGGGDDGFAHSSMVHRFLTVKNLGVKNPTTSSQTRKISSATSSQSLQPQRHQLDAAGRFVAIAHQQQLVQRQSFSAQQQRQDRRPSGVTTLRFGDDGTEHIALVTNSSSNNEPDGGLSALVAGGTAFQPTAAAVGGSRGSSLAQMKPINGNEGPRKTSSGELVTEARPRTPMVVVHVVESGLDGIINSSLGSGSEASGLRSSTNRIGFAPVTRHAILSLARSPNRNPLGSSGFRDVVFHAMNGKSEGPHSGMTMASASGTADSSHFGSIVGAHLHAAAAPAAVVGATPGDRLGSLASGSRSEPRRLRLFTATSEAPSSTSNTRPVTRQSPQQVDPSRSSYTLGTPAAAATSTSPLLLLRPSVVSTPVKSRARQSATPQQQRKRMLPPMSPGAVQPQTRTSPYRLARDGNDSDPASNNSTLSSGPMDLSTSYQTTSYAADPSSRTNTVKASVNGSSSLSALDPFAKSAAPLWYGLKPMKEPSRGKLAKRARTPSPATVTTTPTTRAQKDEIGEPGGPLRPVHQGQRDDPNSLHVSPWDTYEDDDAFDSDFLLGRDWQAFSLIGNDAPAVTPAAAAHEPKLALGSSSSPLKSPHGKRQQQKSRPQQYTSSIAGPETKRHAECYADGPSLIVTSLGSSPAKPSHSFSVPETGNEVPSTGNLETSASSTASGSSDNTTEHIHPSHQQLTTAFSGEIEQLHISKSSLHQHELLPRNASREKGFAGWQDGLAPAPDPELGELQWVAGIGKPVSLEPNNVGLSQPIFPIRSQGCSRCEKRPEDCGLDHCEVAARMQGLESVQSSSLLGLERQKSPVFKLEKRRATLRVPYEDDDVAVHERANRELLDDVTILLNARRELILQPNEGDNGLAKLHVPPTRSEMMKRRYMYTFGRT